MLLVELPPASRVSSPCGKTATRFFGQRETPPKFKAILEEKRERERGGMGGFFCSLILGPSPMGGMRMTDRPTYPAGSLRVFSCQTIFSTPVRNTPSRGWSVEVREGSKILCFKAFRIQSPCSTTFKMDVQNYSLYRRFLVILKFGIIFRSSNSFFFL